MQTEMPIYPIGISIDGNRLNEAIFNECRKTGISAIEVSVSSEDVSPSDYEALRKMSLSSGVSLWSYHLPFCPFEQLDLSVKKLQKETLRQLICHMRLAAEIGIRIFVLHASGEPIEDNEREERLQTAEESLYVLAEEARRLGGTVAVENLPRTCLGKDDAEMLRLLSAHRALRACCDTNHCLTMKPETLIRRLGNRILTLHVSDYDFVNERHWLPGEGKVDWQSVLAALRETGYRGVWLYETGFECPPTILRDRDLTCEDHVLNAREVFAGRNITRISRDKPNLGFWR